MKFRLILFLSFFGLSSLFGASSLKDLVQENVQDYRDWVQSNNQNITAENPEQFCFDRECQTIFNLWAEIVDHDARIPSKRKEIYFFEFAGLMMSQLHSQLNYLWRSDRVQSLVKAGILTREQYGIFVNMAVQDCINESAYGNSMITVSLLKDGSMINNAEPFRIYIIGKIDQQLDVIAQKLLIQEQAKQQKQEQIKMDESKVRNKIDQEQREFFNQLKRLKNADQDKLAKQETFKQLETDVRKKYKRAMLSELRLLNHLMNRFVKLFNQEYVNQEYANYEKIYDAAVIEYVAQQRSFYESRMRRMQEQIDDLVATLSNRSESNTNDPIRTMGSITGTCVLTAPSAIDGDAQGSVVMPEIPVVQAIPFVRGIPVTSVRQNRPYDLNLFEQ